MPNIYIYIEREVRSQRQGGEKVGQNKLSRRYLRTQSEWFILKFPPPIPLPMANRDGLPWEKHDQPQSGYLWKREFMSYELGPHSILPSFCSSSLVKGSWPQKLFRLRCTNTYRKITTQTRNGALAFRLFALTNCGNNWLSFSLGNNSRNFDCSYAVYLICNCYRKRNSKPEKYSTTKHNHRNEGRGLKDRGLMGNFGSVPENISRRNKSPHWAYLWLIGNQIGNRARVLARENWGSETVETGQGTQTRVSAD